MLQVCAVAASTLPRVLLIQLRYIEHPSLPLAAGMFPYLIIILWPQLALKQPSEVAVKARWRFTWTGRHMSQ